MQRFVLTNRRSGGSKPLVSWARLDEWFRTRLSQKARLIGDSNPVDPQKRRVIIVECNPTDIERAKAILPEDVIIEPGIVHSTLADARPLSTYSPLDATEDLPVGKGVSLTVKVIGSGVALEGAQAILYLGRSGRLVLQITFTSLGEAVFEFSSRWTPLRLVVFPAGGFWSAVVDEPEDGLSIKVHALPQDGPLGWWHGAVGVNHFDLTRGTGVKVGVIDTGVGPHGFLSHVSSVGSFIEGAFDPKGGTDSGSHGSLVCGVIGARSAGTPDFAGIAPGVDLACARVFAPGRGANQGDIADAIDCLAEIHQSDLINLSLGSPEASEIVRDAIQDAFERGTLCICAAGNSAGAVEYPAAFPQTVAVSAIGLQDWGPVDSVTSTCQPLEKRKFGLSRRFLANFSCFGSEIDCCAPGVGIISTVPERHGLKTPYAAMNGTSMASPVACGALAAIMSATAEYNALPRDVSRAQRARALLEGNCQDAGMDARFQGRGIPTVGSQLASLTTETAAHVC